VIALLRLYPRHWRERYGEEYALILRATPPGPGTVLDVVRGALDAHVREARPGPVVRWALLVLCAAVVGWLDFHATDDVQPAAAALLVFGFGFGLHRPARAWLCALVLFAAVPVAEAWHAVARGPVLPWQVPSVYESAIALLPALLGAAAGAAVGWTVRRARA
jgi:hypothetical protein